MSVYRAGLLTGIMQVRGMIAECLPADARARLDAWCENVIAWAHGQGPDGWSPPHAFEEQVRLDDKRIPRPVPPARPMNHWQHVSPLAGADGRPAAPPPWAGQTVDRAGGRTYLQELRDRGVHVEDSERP